MYLQWCSIGFNQLQVEHLHVHSADFVKNYTCSFFIELAPGPTHSFVLLRYISSLFHITLLYIST